MSRKSEAVKTWRRNTKRRLVQALGNKCACCGYNKCDEALEFHHIDPEAKEAAFGRIRASSISWARIIEEIKKCILVCGNCHKEIHHGVTKLPKVIPEFDEKYNDYKLLEKMERMDKCPVCGELKRKSNITCSLKCAAIYKYRVDWTSVDLVEELKTKSICKLADGLNISEATIRKRLKKLGLYQIVKDNREEKIS